MKQLEIPFLPGLGPGTTIEEVSAGLDELARTAIDTVCWPAYGYRPQVSAALAHSGDRLLLKYYVREKTVRAQFRRTHDPVYRDSCVELFLALGQEENYYNFEFNSLGTCLSGFGPGKGNRLPLPEALAAKIERWAWVQAPPAAGQDTAWQLTLRIPAEVFWQHQLVSFQGLQGRGNLYKCGDDLPEPHFLSWTAIKAPAPDFHLPAYFGRLQFG